MVLPKGLRKPQTRKKGLKVLVYGDTGTGKTLFALSFPRSVVLDSEDGYSWYEGTDKVKNLLAIENSQSFTVLEKLLKDLDKVTLDDMDTFIIDSETKVYENIQEALQSIEEKRARQKGRDVLDTNLSVRSWGQIKRLAKKLQNQKIMLATKGFNVVSVAQSKDITEDLGNGTRIKIGSEADMDKKAKYDYDLVLRLYTDEEDNYMGEILKDRTEVTKKGDIIANPSYEIWANTVEGKANQGVVIEKDFNSDLEKSKEAYEKNVEEESPMKDRVIAFMKKLPKDKQKEFGNKIIELGNGKKNPNDFTKDEKVKVVELMGEYAA
ncbi:AAA family ATPase [Lactobacillus sp. AN1001]